MWEVISKDFMMRDYQFIKKMMRDYLACWHLSWAQWLVHKTCIFLRSSLLEPEKGPSLINLQISCQIPLIESFFQKKIKDNHTLRPLPLFLQRRHFADHSPSPLCLWFSSSSSFVQTCSTSVFFLYCLMFVITFFAFCFYQIRDFVGPFGLSLLLLKTENTVAK